MTGGASDLALLGRVMGGLIIVIVLIGLIAKVARQTRGHKGDSGLRVVDRVGLSREANLAVVEVSNRMLLLGVTAQGVTMLANLDRTNDADPAAVDLYDVNPEPAAQHQPGLDGTAQDDLYQQYEQDDEDSYYGRPAAPAEVVLSQIELDVSDTVDGLTVIRTVQPAEWPESIEPAEPAQPIPAEVALDDYPDLATALRAAGRTADLAPPDPIVPSWADAEALAEIPAERYPNNSYLDDVDEVDELDELDDDDFYSDEPAAPRTRAEARAQQRPAGRSWIPLSRNRFTAASSENPEPVQTAGPTEPTRIKVPPAPRPKKARRVVVSSTAQASGSVLSPNTWRQGLEALRELTVRRG